jgi:release factor glutamine methyltransferase
LQREVLFEPRQALSGGDDGLYFYRRICAGCAGRLVSSGLLIVEIGYGRAQDVRALISSAPGMKVEDTVKDYAGIERVVVARRRT